MTYKEYQEQVKTINAENYTTIVADIMKELESDMTNMDSMKVALTEKDKKIRDLQDANLKLFLSVTGKQEEDKEEDEPLTPQQELEELLKRLTED